MRRTTQLQGFSPPTQMSILVPGVDVRYVGQQFNQQTNVSQTIAQQNVNITYQIDDSYIRASSVDAIANKNVLLFWYPDLNSIELVDYNTWVAHLNSNNERHFVSNGNVVLKFRPVYKSHTNNKIIASTYNLLKRYNTFKMVKEENVYTTFNEGSTVYRAIPFNRSSINILTPLTDITVDPQYFPTNYFDIPSIPIDDRIKRYQNCVVLLEFNGAFSEVNPLNGVLYYHFTINHDEALVGKFVKNQEMTQIT